MTDRLVTRKQVNSMYGFGYCSESYRRWERQKLLNAIKAGKGQLRSTRVYYWLSNVITVFGPVPNH